MMIQLSIYFIVLLLCLAVAAALMALFFHREIASIRLARLLGPALDSFECQRCGLCCCFSVITDRATIQAMEEETGQPKERFSTPFLYCWAKLKKGVDGACVLRTTDDPDQSGAYTCAAYAARPRACRRFPRICYPVGLHGADHRCPHIRKLAEAARSSSNSACGDGTRRGSSVGFCANRNANNKRGRSGHED